MLGGQGLQPVADNLLGVGLHIAVQRRLDGQPALQQPLVTQPRFQQAPHVHDEMRGGDREALGGEVQRLGGGPVGVGLREVAVVDHAVQHVALAGAGGVGRGQGVILAGSLGQPGQQRRFGQVQVAHALAEIGPAGRFDPIGHVAVIDLVEVHFQNRVFAVVPVDLVGQHRLADLAAQRALPGLCGREEDGAGQLLGNGAAARHDLPAGQVGPQRAQQPACVQAGVGVEGVILGGDGRVAQDLGHAGQRDEGALPALRVEQFVEQLAVAVKNAGGGERRPPGQPLHRRQIVDHPAQARPAQPDQQQAGRQRDLQPAPLARGTRYEVRGTR